MKKLASANTILTLVMTALVLQACATYRSVPVSAENDNRSPTIVLFLVDGLGAQALQQALSAGKAPEIQKFFLKGEKKFPIGRASFPTLTYPNLSSILTTDPVGKQPIISNHVVVNSKVIDFESAGNHDTLRQIIDPNSVIANLAKNNQATASFSYVLGQNADSHTLFGIREGLEYERHDYEKLDGRLLDNFENYLQDTNILPKFIYIHLVGVDGRSHQYGPYSPRTLKYVEWLDHKMGPVLKKLRQLEHTNTVVSILTADHGFASTPNYVNLEKKLKKELRGTILVNESRFISVFFRKHKQENLIRLKAYLQLPEIEYLVLHDEGKLIVLSKDKQIRFQYLPGACAPYTFALQGESVASSFALANYQDQKFCPQVIDQTHSADLPPYFLSNLANFLNAPTHPDAVLLAANNFTFQKEQLGSHGGATLEEITVPVLTRNAKFHSSELLPTFDLLKELKNTN